MELEDDAGHDGARGRPRGRVEVHAVLERARRVDEALHDVREQRAARVRRARLDDGARRGRAAREQQR